MQEGPKRPEARKNKNAPDTRSLARVHPRSVRSGVMTCCAKSGLPTRQARISSPRLTAVRALPPLSVTLPEGPGADRPLEIRYNDRCPD